jgi:2-polyprenyl-6-methoxyphenol hydroxylase-like FAD-dependent oxidoreductase
MRVVIVGSGPVGSACGLMLARRGHQVVLVDRDAGPDEGGSWTRRGVMQFDLPHFFRPLVRQAIVEEMPELWSALLLAGGLPALPPGFPEQMTGLQCRRRTFERALWAFTDAEPGVVRLAGHADRVVLDGDRVRGVVVDGAPVDADVVIVASGRGGRLADDLRAPGEGGSCGFSYAARQYRARPGVELPAWGLPNLAMHDGYYGIVFPQDGATITALIVRPTGDARLAELRHNDVFDAAAAAVPLLAEWTDPARFEAICDVRAGSNLTNAYRGQRNSAGGITAAGLFFVGDAVCTTNPAAGRGVALGMAQARTLITLLDGDDGMRGVAVAFDDWCTDNVKPWYDDHVYWDATVLRRFAGEDIDVDARIPSDVVCACAQVDPSIFAAAGPYLGMLATPRILDSVQDKARAVLQTGWRPAYAEGPTRDELVELVRLQSAAVSTR